MGVSSSTAVEDSLAGVKKCSCIETVDRGCLEYISCIVPYSYLPYLFPPHLGSLDFPFIPQHCKQSICDQDA